MKKTSIRKLLLTAALMFVAVFFAVSCVSTDDLQSEGVSGQTYLASADGYNAERAALCQ